MYKILVVDDEPRVSTGIRNFLVDSELNISVVETALNGFEAIDYLRMDTFDLVLTDIQMSRMTGIELMETIYMEQPLLPVIVISAHEEFDFAKRSLRLGAKDYLVKPVEQEELLRIVGRVLSEKEDLGKKTIEQSRWQSREEQERSPVDRRQEILMELVTERSLTQKDYETMASELGELVGGRDFGVVSVRLDLSHGGFSRREVSLQDRKLLKYASINILEESLTEWKGFAFNGYGNELIAVIQLEHVKEQPSEAHRQTQLHLIGQMIHLNLKQYLNIETSVGLSRLHADVFMLPKLMEEATTAAEWKKLYPGQKVFYYEDVVAHENLKVVAWVTEIDVFIQKLKTNLDDTESPVDPHTMVVALRELDSSEEMFNSHFGMLVYRIYGLLMEYGHTGGTALQRFDPDVYFRNAAQGSEKLERLKAYIQETIMWLRSLVKERDQSLVARITEYIHAHYRNPALKIQDIASEVHFSTAYLSYLFKMELNRNIWDYVTELRIEEARRLLVTTEMKRYEIAYAVGYESPEHFSRMFKRYVGVSPADYRKARQEGSR